MKTYDKRFSGRSTRLIQQAFSLQSQGKQVLIVTANGSKQIIEKRMIDLSCEYGMGCPPREIEVKSLNQVGTEAIDWRKKRLKHFSGNLVLLIDHEAYMQHYGHILDGFHEYDQPTYAIGDAVVFLDSHMPDHIMIVSKVEEHEIWMDDDKKRAMNFMIRKAYGAELQQQSRIASIASDF